MVIAQLAEGDHTIEWSLNGYDTLTAMINVSATGTVTCRSVTGSSCGATAAPKVTISGLTVTGYLRAAATPSPTPAPTPTPTPRPATPTPQPGELCGWMASKGGPSGITIPNIFELEDATMGFGNLGFVPTNQQIMGIYDYSMGFTGSGNSKTGCLY